MRRLLLRLALNALLIWAIATVFPQYLGIGGRWYAPFVIGAALGLANLVVHPLLDILIFPLRLVATLLAIMILNAAFLWITLRLMEHVDPLLAQLTVHGGVKGWVFIATALGVGNWLTAQVLRGQQS